MSSPKRPLVRLGVSLLAALVVVSSIAGYAMVGVHATGSQLADDAHPGAGPVRGPDELNRNGNSPMADVNASNQLSATDSVDRRPDEANGPTKQPYGPPESQADKPKRPQNEAESSTDEPIEFEVDESIEPHRSHLQRPDGQREQRPVARVVDPAGVGTDFVADELIVEGTRADARALVDRFGGEILDAYDPDRIASLDGQEAREAVTPSTDGSDKVEEGVFRLRLDVENVDPATVERDSASLQATGGEHSVSSPDGLGLLAAAINATAQDYVVKPNWVAQKTTFTDDDSIEGNGADVFDWCDFNDDTCPPIGVTQAWKHLEESDNLDSRISIAVLDMGFAPNDDIRSGAYPRGPVGHDAWEAPKGYWGPRDDGTLHGTKTASAALGKADNSYGAAGTAGPVADPILVETSFDDYYLSRDIRHAFYYWDANVLTISLKIKRLGLSEVFGSRHLADATSDVRNDGGLVFASAGNQGANVDEKRVAREKRDWFPCESDGVICVGGTKTGSDWEEKHPSSNYGTGSGSNSVDIYAPFKLRVGPILNQDRSLDEHSAPRIGTSYSTPYVAGIAALVKAADPSLSADEVEELLYETSMDSSDPKVNRIVNAEAAVREALTGDPPVIEETSVPGDTFARGSESVRLEATVSDPENSLKTVEWISDRDGVLLESESGRTTFETYGVHELRVRAVDWGGQEVVSDPIRVEVTNEEPEPEILSPADGERIPEGETITFEGVATDPNEVELPSDDERDGYRLDGEHLEWFVTDGDRGTRIGYGEEVSTTLSPGTYTVTLRATDNGGATNETSIDIEVVRSGEPVVQITGPEDTDVSATHYDSEREESYAIVNLSGEGWDSDGEPMTGDQLTWKRVVVGTYECDTNRFGTCFGSFEKTFGTGEQATIRLYQTQDGDWEETYTIYLYGTDGDATVRDSIEITVYEHVS